jgi:hypothetical protein
MTPKKPQSGGFSVGYGKPPVHSRFRRGVSGNPRGRPRGVSTDRAVRLMLKEAYRLIAVREGEETRGLPGLQAAIRKLLHMGLKGNGSALRDFISIVREMEQDAARQQSATGNDVAAPREDISDEMRATALLAFIARTKRS